MRRGELGFVVVAPVGLTAAPSTNRRAVAVSGAWMVVGGEFMRFVDDEEVRSELLT